jgi:hypothetical protein
MGLSKHQIKQWAHQANCTHVNVLGDQSAALERLQRFAQLVADHALEDAARTCEARAKDAPAPLAAECLLCAVAIRAMKGNP